jgi:aromatic-L-amino-acid decarboxylase
VNDTSLDPADWGAFRRVLHDAVDGIVDDLAGLRDEPAWRAIPDSVKRSLREPLPRAGEPIESTLATFDDLVRPYSTGNRHPRFFGWVHGAGTPAGVLAEMLAAGMNANVGGREHAAVYVERQVIAWFAELFGFPADASGILTSGTSMGNLLAITAARDAALGPTAREQGLAGARLTAYAARSVHDCVAKALRIAGIGTAALRLIDVDERHAIDVDALRGRIAADRAAGDQPFLVVGTAGSVDTGAFDRLDALADLCADQGLWFHVDGAFGGLAAASPAHAHLVRGIERADSLAFDAHKWLQAPYGVGCVLFRDEQAHRSAFTSNPEYLARSERGTAGGAPWFADYGLELSREFRALKVWFTLRHFGFERLGSSIARSCELATALGERVAADAGLELLAPVTLNVVCFRYHVEGLGEAELDGLNAEIAIDVQESGAAVLSTTRIGGRNALRACIINHRTREEDLDIVLAAVRSAGMCRAGAAPVAV